MLTYADAPEMAELGLIAPLGNILSQLSQGGGAKGINIDAVSPSAPCCAHAILYAVNQCLRQLASSADIFPQLQCTSCMSVFLNMHDIAFYAADALLKSRTFGSRVRHSQGCCLTTACLIGRTGDYCTG